MKPPPPSTQHSAPVMGAFFIGSRHKEMPMEPPKTKTDAVKEICEARGWPYTETLLSRFSGLLGPVAYREPESSDDWESMYEQEWD